MTVWQMQWCQPKKHFLPENKNILLQNYAHLVNKWIKLTNKYNFCIPSWTMTPVLQSVRVSQLFSTENLKCCWQRWLHQQWAVLAVNVIRMMMWGFMSARMSGWHIRDKLYETLKSKDELGGGVGERVALASVRVIMSGGQQGAYCWIKEYILSLGVHFTADKKRRPPAHSCKWACNEGSIHYLFF